MSSRGRKHNHVRSVLAPILLAFAGLVVLIGFLLRGHNVALVHTSGLIAGEQFKLIATAVGIMLLIAIPAVFMLYFVVWKYRDTNRRRVRHDPNGGPGKLVVAAMWLAPGAIALVIGLILIPATHRLEPQKRIAAEADNMTIQVVAMRWKWLFIYPEERIATVNYVQVPVNTPVTFLLTADETPMTAFWIPNWGGMLHAMNGHVNQLNLLAEKAGEYPGSTAEINGAGFAGMRFTASATSREDFDKWVRGVQVASDKLDEQEYAQLLEPSESNPEAFYSLPEGDLYAKVVMKYKGAHDHHPAAYHGGH